MTFTFCPRCPLSPLLGSPLWASLPAGAHFETGPPRARSSVLSLQPGHSPPGLIQSWILPSLHRGSDLWLRPPAVSCPPSPCISWGCWLLPATSWCSVTPAPLKCWVGSFYTKGLQLGDGWRPCSRRGDRRTPPQATLVTATTLRTTFQSMVVIAWVHCYSQLSLTFLLASRGAALRGSPPVPWALLS